MTIYRIAHEAYSSDLSGQGAKMNGGRWNSPGYALVYTAGHISLSLLEMLVHINFTEINYKMHMLHIDIPEIHKIAEIKMAHLKPDWVKDEGYTRFIGDEFIKNNESLLLQVPSVIVPEENNFLINPLHADFKKVSIAKEAIINFDNRLLITR